MHAPRPECLRCRRPVSHCWCDRLASVPSRTRIVFLQHPREHRVAIGTARMAHLSLPNSELHVGADLDRHPRVRALVTEAEATGRTAVLFPGPEAVEPEALAGGPPTTLVVLDGTWTQARKMLARSALLQRLPRVAFTPAAPGNYRIRREPAPHCLATVEAVAEILGRLEDDADRFRPLLGAFDHMVERQLVFKTTRPNPYHRDRRARRPVQDPLATTLAARKHDVVVVYAEANAHPRTAAVPGDPEIIQLVAERVADGARFAAVIAPRRPLARAAPAHLELDAAVITAGEPVGDALTRWRAFVRPTDLLCAWGGYTRDLLAAEDAGKGDWIDLRAGVAHRLGRRPGGGEAAARALAGDALPAPALAGRAGRRLVALVAIVRALADAPLVPAPPAPRTTAGGSDVLAAHSAG